MKKDELIKKIEKTTSLVEFYKLKEDILQFLKPEASKGKAKEDE